MLLHDGEDLDDDLGRGSDHDLPLSSSLSVDDVVLKVSNLSSAFSVSISRSASIPSKVPILKQATFLHDSLSTILLAHLSKEARLTKASLSTETRTILTKDFVF